MSANNKKFGLGRGLESLLGDNIDLTTSEYKDNVGENTVFKKDGNSEIKVDDIVACKFQPRTEFNAELLQSLADSIKEKGVLQPLLLRKKGDKYEIIAGERRWRAARLAGLKTVPALIKNLNDKETLEIALIENLQRENLSAIEEADGLNKLASDYNYTQEMLAKAVGKSRSYVANSLRLLGLPAEIKVLVKNGKLSAGHARALVGCSKAVELANEIIKNDLSVRQTEHLLAKLKNTPSRRQNIADADLLQIMRDLEQKLNIKVKINASQNGKGSVILKYDNPAELSSILDLLEQR